MQAVTLTEDVMRIFMCGTLCAALLVLGGCDMHVLAAPECIPGESGDCGTPIVIPGPAAYLVGFPRSWLDTTTISGGVRGVMHVGDTVTLYAIAAVNFPSDTLQTVDWSVDIATARITMRSDGGITLQATTVGPVFVRTGSLVAVWSSCAIIARRYTCTNVDEVDVVP
jgi:hypothetical protein